MNRLLILVLLLGCGTPKPPPFKPDPYGPAPADVCERFCAILDQNDCAGEDGSPGYDEVRGNADDVPCARVCTDTLSKGTYVADAGCLGAATSCEAAEACVLGP